jgi:hypothetical protein
VLIYGNKQINTGKIQWDIEDAHRTIQRAEAIKADKSMMKDVIKHHNMMTKALGGAIKSAPAKVSPSKPSKKK